MGLISVSGVVVDIKGNLDPLRSDVAQAKNMLRGIGSGAGDGFTQATAQTQSWSTALKGANTNLKTMATNAGIAIGAFGAVGKVAWDLGQVGFSAERSNVALRSLTSNADAWIKAVQEGAGYTLTQGQAAAQAFQLINFNLVDSADAARDFVEDMRVIAAVSPSINSVDDAIAQLQLTLANQSYMRFDQLGLDVVAVKARIKELQAETKGLSTELAFQQAVMEAVSNASEKYGTEIVRVGENTAWLETKIDSTREKFGLFFAEGIEGWATMARAIDEVGASAIFEEATGLGPGKTAADNFGLTQAQTQGYYMGLSYGGADYVQQLDSAQRLYELIQAFPDAPVESFLDPSAWTDYSLTPWEELGYNSADAFLTGYNSYASGTDFFEAAFRGTLGEFWGAPMAATPSTPQVDYSGSRGAFSSYSGAGIIDVTQQDLLYDKRLMESYGESVDGSALALRRFAYEREKAYTRNFGRIDAGYLGDDMGMNWAASQSVFAPGTVSRGTEAMSADPFAAMADAFGASGLIESVEQLADAADSAAVSFDSLGQKFGTDQATSFDRDVYGEIGDALRGVDIDAGLAEEAMTAYAWATGIATSSSELFDSKLALLTQQFADGEMNATEYADAVRTLSTLDTSWVDAVTAGMDFTDAMAFIDRLSTLTTGGMTGVGAMSEDPFAAMGDAMYGDAGDGSTQQPISVFSQMAADAQTASGEIAAAFATATSESGNAVIEFHNLHTGEYTALEQEAVTALRGIEAEARRVMGQTYTMTITTTAGAGAGTPPDVGTLPGYAEGTTWTGYGATDGVAGITHYQEAVVPAGGMYVTPSPSGLQLHGGGGGGGNVMVQAMINITDQRDPAAAADEFLRELKRRGVDVERTLGGF